MIWALNQFGQRVRADVSLRNTGCVCPCCHKPVVPHCGEVKTWHWEHQSAKDCDSWSDGETEWHIGWKSQFPVGWQEIVVGQHRADIKTSSGLVVEFQHSYLKSSEVMERTEFYNDITWVFDCREAFLAVIV